MNKILILVIIALFLGLAFIPSFNAVSTKEVTSEYDETFEIYDYLNVTWKRDFLFLRLTIINNLNRSVTNIRWKYQIENYSAIKPFKWYVKYPTEPIFGSQETLIPNGKSEVRINVRGFGFMWNLFQVTYDDYWGSPTLDLVRETFIFGPFILFLSGPR